jgi:hypothetical protein
MATANEREWGTRMDTNSDHEGGGNSRENLSRRSSAKAEGTKSTKGRGIRNSRKRTQGTQNRRTADGSAAASLWRDRLRIYADGNQELQRSLVKPRNACPGGFRGEISAPPDGAKRSLGKGCNSREKAQKAQKKEGEKIVLYGAAFRTFFLRPFRAKSSFCDTPRVRRLILGYKYFTATRLGRPRIPLR